MKKFANRLGESLKPGSPEAILSGCTCTSPNNHEGQGWFQDGEYYGYDVSFDCPLHGLGQHGEGIDEAG
jgi:hypothetical protein